MRVFSVLGALIGLAQLGCTGEESDDGGGLDHTAFYEQLEHDKTYTDVAFDFDTVTQFRTSDVLESLDVRALGVVGDLIYAGTADGLFRLADGGAAFVRVGAAGPIVDIDVDGETLVAAEVDRVHLVNAGAISATRMVTTATITSVTASADVAYVGSIDGVWVVDTATVVRVAGTEGIAVVDLVLVDGQLLVAEAEAVTRVTVSTGVRDRVAIADEVRGVARDEVSGFLIVAAERLYQISANGQAVAAPEPGRRSFPTGAFTAVEMRDGVLFTGHEVGASVFRPGRIEHYASRRWIPDQRVNDVAFGPNGERWIATSAGVSRVWFDTTTFAERAALNESFLDNHWRMDGFVDDNMGLDDQYDLTSNRTGDHDNDGLWTEMQIGAWCYAYAVTKDQTYYDKARRAMDVMFLQIDIPGVSFEAAGMKRGFITRSLVRDDEGAVFDDKVPRENWHLQTYEGRDYYWKDDTSSDEYAGHYFGIPIFYDLCAQTEDEKAAIRDRIRLTTDYLIDNEYRLIDLDGQPTLHGHWEDLGIAANGVDACTREFGTEQAGKCLESRHGGGWLNGAEILGHLLAAWHITGDEKYYDEYERLFTAERYGQIVQVIDDTFTVTRPNFANHSDHELAMLAFTTLVRYDPHADRRAMYEQSLVDFYEYEREEHNPWQIAVIGSVHAGDVDLDGAVRTLQEMPTDWRTWRYDNSHRVDAERWPNDRHGEKQFNRVFPYDEVRTMKWNGSPYVVVGGGSGRSLLAPTPYLLAYWMLRYYGMMN